MENLRPSGNGRFTPSRQNDEADAGYAGSRVAREGSDPCAIQSDVEVHVLEREVRRALVASFPGINAHLHAEDSTRWHALGMRCRQARGACSIRQVSVAIPIPQYRLRAVETGLLREVRPDLARRYFHFRHRGMDSQVVPLQPRAGLARRSSGRHRATPAWSPLIRCHVAAGCSEPAGSSICALHRRRIRRPPGIPSGTRSESGHHFRSNRGVGDGRVRSGNSWTRSTEAVYSR